MEFLDILLNQTYLFLLIFARISGIFTAAPILGSRNVPIQVKAGFSLMLSYTLLPLIVATFHDPLPVSTFGFIWIIITEFIVGLTIGFASSLIFSAVQMTGALLDMQIGFGVVNIIDPQSGHQVPLVGNFLYILAIILFLTINGHHLLLMAIFSSFKSIPLIHVIFQTSIVSLMVDMVAGIFIVAFKISLPVLVSLLLTDVALGILARTMPQMNIFIVGIPGKIGIGLFILFLILPIYIGYMEVGFGEMFKNLYRLIALFSG